MSQPQRPAGDAAAPTSQRFQSPPAGRGRLGSLSAPLVPSFSTPPPGSVAPPPPPQGALPSILSPLGQAPSGGGKGGGKKAAEKATLPPLPLAEAPPNTEPPALSPAEYAAVLEWRRRNAAEHAETARQEEDEALQRYVRNCGLLSEVLSEEERPLASLFDAGGAQACQTVLAELQRALEARGREGEGAGASAEAAGARAERRAAFERFSRGVDGASSLQEVRMSAF